jgi:hypothetical protein
MTNAATPGGYSKTPGVSYQCAHGKCSNCTKQTCTHECHDIEKISSSVLDLKTRPGAFSHS